MSKHTNWFFALSFFVFSCAGTTEDLELDLTDSSEEIEDAEEKASNSANTGFFVVTRRDMRRCISPLCGGYFVKRVNAEKTRCADGNLRNECYVSEITLGGMRLSDREASEFMGSLAEGKALIKARAYRHRFSRTWLGKLKASEGWLGATGSTPDGTFYRVADNGTRCVTTPCPSTTAYGLNGAEDHRLIRSNLENTESPAEETSLFQAQNAIGTREGIIIAGGIAIPRCLPSARDCGPFASASEFYLKVTHREGESCGGFRREQAACGQHQYCAWAAGDLCGAADAPGTCQYRAEVCIALYDPVCGCDGRTYGNACNASSAGASILHDGECTE